MFTDWLRKVFGGMLGAMGKGLVRLGIGANLLTLIGCLLNIGAALIIARGHLRWGGVALLFASAFDALDGTAARASGGSTRFGAFWDSFLDRISEASVLLGLAWFYMVQGAHTEVLLAYVAIVGSLLVSYARARAEALGIECKVGLLTRVERCGLIILGLITRLTAPLLWILAIGAPLTAFHRAWHVYRQAKDQPADAT